MSTSIIAVFAQSAGTGHVLRLAVAGTDGIGISCSGVATTLAFHVAMHRAFIAVWNLLGQPAYLPAVACSFAPIGGEQTLPSLDGGSLYGAFSLILTQFFAMRLPAEHKRKLCHYVRAQWNAIERADLSVVAVSANGEAATGDFLPVDGIDQKLRSLAKLEHKELSCVLAPGQTVPSIVNDPDTVPRVVNIAPADFLSTLLNLDQSPKDVGVRKTRTFPILYALDPIDALGQVFERQCKVLAGRLA
jgi:hypothetical protein